MAMVNGRPPRATDADTITGTDTIELVTPSNLTAKIDTDGTLAGNADTRIPSQKAVKTYADAKVAGPGAVTASDFVQFNGTTGLAVKGGLALSTDGTMAGNSDTAVPSQKAVKTYADGIIAAADALVYKGVTDCSGNPNYPAADAGHTYRVSVAGKIGGAAGVNVEVGDMAMCNTDGTAAGDQATVGAKWNIIQVNIDGTVVGPASAVSGQIVSFNGVTGKIIQESSLWGDSTSLGFKTVTPGYSANAWLGDSGHSYLTVTGADDKRAILELGSHNRSGGIAFINTANTNVNEKHSYALVRVYSDIVTSDVNAHGDSGGNLVIAMRPENDEFYERLRINPDGSFSINNSGALPAWSTATVTPIAWKNAAIYAANSIAADSTRIALVSNAFCYNGSDGFDWSVDAKPAALYEILDGVHTFYAAGTDPGGGASIDWTNVAQMDIDGFKLFDANGAVLQHTVLLKINETNTGNRTLNLKINNADRTVDLTGNLTVESASIINQDLTTDASPTFVTAKLTGLTDGYVPYHVADATGLANGPIYVSGNNIALGTTDVEAWQSAYRALQLGGSSALMFHATTAGLFLLDNAYYDGAWKYRSAAASGKVQASGGTFQFDAASSGSADAAITWNTALALQNDGDAQFGGKVGIGVDPTSYLHVQADSAGVYLAYICNTNNTAGQEHGLKIQAGVGATDVPLYIVTRAGADIFTVYGNATTTIADGGGLKMATWPTTANAANAWVGNAGLLSLSTSLRANKHDFQPITLDDARRTVQGLKPVLYRSRIDDDQRQWAGMIAEDVEMVNPILASYDDKGALQGITYDRIPMYLIPVVQDLMGQVQQLTERLEKLEAA